MVLWVTLTSTFSSEDCPGKVDQKKPLQSGSSNMYGRIRVSNLMQFNTEVQSEKELIFSNKYIKISIPVGSSRFFVKDFSVVIYVKILFAMNLKSVYFWLI